MLISTIVWLNVLAFRILFCVAESRTTSPASLITPAPAPELVRDILQKRDPYGSRNDFIGYYTSPGSSGYYGAYCLGNTYAETYVSGYWYAGCQGTDTYMTLYTTCYGNSAYGISYYTSGTYSGTKYNAYVSCSYTCLYDYLDSNYGTLSYYAHCASRNPYTFYRMSSLTFEAYRKITLTITPTTTPTSPASTSTATTTSIITGPTVTYTPPPGKSIAGPIAGGVIGGIAVLAGIAVGIWALLKRKRTSSSNVEGQNQPVILQQPNQGYPPSGPGAPGFGGVSPPEKVALSSTILETPASPYAPQQTWVPSPQGSPPPPQPWAAPAQSWAPHQTQTFNVAPAGNNPAVHQNFSGISPPSSPPPPGYYPSQAQQIHPEPHYPHP